MKRDLINEDTNQFGPGTDLIICLFALMMVFLMISLYLFSAEKAKSTSANANTQAAKDEIADLKDKIDRLTKNEKFRLAGYFHAGTFKPNPYYVLNDPMETGRQVDTIVMKYRNQSSEYPFIFVIGHANEISLAGRPDLTERERLEWNWQFAGARSAVIANLLQERLGAEEKEKIIIVSTGEFDKRIPDEPFSQENAFVEVLFGKDWKPQHYEDIR